MADDAPLSPGTSIQYCKNIRSKKNSKERCINIANQGDFCRIHKKNPILWVPAPIDHLMETVRIQEWYRKRRGLFFVKRHGIGYWDRSILTNDSDFFSTDPMSDVQGIMFLSYVDSHNHVYGFDIRSIHSLYDRAQKNNETPINPFTRNEFPDRFTNRVNTLVSVLRRRKISIEWVQLMPSTPEQQLHMKIVDLFNKIDELNYYSSPDWFIGLTHFGQIRFYRELYDIWNVRAGLSRQQKEMIVPNFQTAVFKHSPWLISDQSMAHVQKINMNTIRILITSAEDKNDRILGAMYVITALTIVCKQARNAYPWLYESVQPTISQNTDIVQNEILNVVDMHLNGFNWLQNFLQIPFYDTIPALMLPSPIQTAENDQFQHASTTSSIVGL